jgi:hypothetical protein
MSIHVETEDDLTGERERKANLKAEMQAEAFLDKAQRESWRHFASSDNFPGDELRSEERLNMEALRRQDF